jgi:hypothetical protein
MRKTLLLVVTGLLVLSLPAWAATLRVKTNRTPIRSGPGTDTAIVALVSQGDDLELIDVIPEWYKVRDPRSGKVGFVLATLVEMLPGSGAGGRSVGQPAKGGPPRPAGAPGRPLPPGPGEWRDRAFVAVSGGYQVAAPSFSYSFSPAEFAYAEKAHVNAHYAPEAAIAFEGGAGVRVWKNLAVGAMVSVFSKSTPVSVDGTVPHPLYLNRDRSITGTFSAARQDTAAHVQATWVVPVGRHVLLSIAGGPSYFYVSQDIADGINLSTVYPYDTTEVTGARTSRASKGRLGFNAGADVAFYFTRSVGVGGFVRFAQAKLTFQTPGDPVNVTAGGVQGGVGLRLRIGRPAPPRGPAKAPPPPPNFPIKKD